MDNKALLMIIRIGWVVAFIGGSIYWATSNSEETLPLFHVVFGSLITIALLILVYKAMSSGVSKGFIVLAAVWTLGLPVWGLIQQKVFPDNVEWIAQLIHVIWVVGAIGIAEMLGAKTGRKVTEGSKAS